MAVVEVVVDVPAVVVADQSGAVILSVQAFRLT